MSELAELGNGSESWPLPKAWRTRIIRQLESILESDTPTARIASDNMRQVMSPACVRQLLRARSRRTEFFNSKLFADPAWDMLLELYATELGQVRVSVSSLCIASGVPGTTALRWIGTLVSEGLVQREDDRLDARRTFVRLTHKGFEAMNAYFQSLPSTTNSI